MTDLTPLFTTVAQVTFTLAGLLAIAVVSDEKSRRFWLGFESRAIFVFLSFMFLLIPGVFSIGGLVLTSSSDKLAIVTPAWPLSAALAGGLYGLMLYLLKRPPRSAKDDPEFRRLDKTFSVTYGYRLMAVGFSALSAIGFWEYWRHASPSTIGYTEIVVGAFLTIGVLLGVIISVQFFRYDTEVKTNPSPAIDSQPTQTPLSAHGSLQQDERESTNRGDLTKGSLVVLLALLLAFVAGIITDRTTD